MRQRKDTAKCFAYKWAMNDPESGARDSLNRKIEHLIAESPTWARAFIAWRMACVGCDLAGYHTARQALEIYGVSEEEFRASLKTGADQPGTTMSHDQ